MAVRLPSLIALRAFEAVSRHLSFTRAALELNLTQTAVSHQIRSLEEHLGATRPWIDLMAEQSTRLVDVEWDHDQSQALFRAGVEVVALDRSRLLRDVANSLSEQHVNIVACSTHTGSDRVAKMRFEFEMGAASHLDSVLRTIRQIDGVFDAYRLVPGKGT